MPHTNENGIDLNHSGSVKKSGVLRVYGIHSTPIPGNFVVEYTVE